MQRVQVDFKACQHGVVYGRRLGVPGRVVLGGFPHVVEPAVLPGRRRRDYELCRTASRQRRRYRLHDGVQVAYERRFVYRYASGHGPASEVSAVRRRRQSQHSGTI